ncbi:MAG TPA: hypothetical protein VLK85_22165 [Ramlibacter sp.]|nr:hypothetical protein [Ramlibacter sp.]
MKQLIRAAALAAALPALAAGPDPSDPAVPVPPPSYRSVFPSTLTGVEQQSVPWKDANAQVGRFPRGHIDLLRWEEQEGEGATPAAAQPAAAPASAPRQSAPAPAATHQHH